MPEIPNVVLDEVVESEWGNDIRDRTIQRYADPAERSALHAAPANGDLSYLNNTGLVYVYHSGSWTMLSHQGMGGAQEGVTTAADSAWANGANVTFTKPATWAGYNIMAWGSVTFRTERTAPGNPIPLILVRIAIGGVAGADVDAVGADVSPNFYPVTLTSFYPSTPLTASATVAIQFSRTAGTVQKQASSVQYMAIRTS